MLLINLTYSLIQEVPEILHLLHSPCQTVFLISGGSLGENVAKENAEFEAQRQGAIAEAARGGARKVFGGGNKPIVDRNVRTIMDMGFTQEQAEQALKQTRNNVDKALHSLQFIELFRGEECLWKITSKDYHNNVKREAAYTMLVQKVKEIDPLANKTLVTKKINSLRTAFRKELRKTGSLVSGMSADDMYVPKLWYFDQLLFLTDQEVPMMSKSSLSAATDVSAACKHDICDSIKTQVNRLLENSKPSH
ncbi:hypothetical protein J6590_032429 [Homalodisca vitripennis]|nr:hypothetical protein J6590_032429 [Homalodisca vitripennis]